MNKKLRASSRLSASMVAISTLLAQASASGFLPPPKEPKKKPEKAPVQYSEEEEEKLAELFADRSSPGRKKYKAFKAQLKREKNEHS